MGAEGDGTVAARVGGLVRLEQLAPHQVRDDHPHVGGGGVQLLAQRGRVRQPGRLDQRGADEPVRVDQDLAAVQRDPQPQPLVAGRLPVAVGQRRPEPRDDRVDHPGRREVGVEQQDHAVAEVDVRGLVRVDAAAGERPGHELVQLAAQVQPCRVGAVWMGEPDDVDHHDCPMDRLGGHGITRSGNSVAGRPVG